MTSLSHLLSCLYHDSVLGEAPRVGLCAGTKHAHASVCVYVCARACPCVQPSLKAFKRERERGLESWDDIIIHDVISAGWLWHMGSFSVSSHFHSSVSVIDSQTTGYICKLGDVKFGSQLQTKNKTNWIIKCELDAAGSWFAGTFNPSVIRGVPAEFYKDCINLAVYASVRLLFRFTQPPCPCVAVLNEIEKKQIPHMCLDVRRIFSL